LAAQGGFTADLALLDGNFFPSVYAITPNIAAMTDALGSRDMIGEVSFKPWCAARQTMAATQALREILDQGVNVNDIAAIKATILPPHRRMIDHGVTPGDRASYLTGVQYNMAIAAVAPELADVLSPVAEQVPDAVHALMCKITVEPDEGLAADYPRVWPAHVTVTTGARTVERRVDFVPGDPSRAFTADRVEAKFRRFVAPAIGQAKAEGMLQAALALVDGGSPGALLQQIAGVFTSSAASSRPR
jgi:2-methylcitrate dehydratase PrpD